MSDTIWAKTRPLLYHLTFLGFWAIWSLPPLLNNQPASFQAAGTIVVGYAVFTLSRTRSRYEATYRDWTNRRFTAHLNKLNEQAKVAEERMSNTVDLISLHLAQACDRLAITHPWTITSDENWRKFVEHYNQGIVKEIPYPELEEKISESARIERDFKDFEARILPWMHRVWRLEVALLVIGTLQSGYGDQMVEALHNGVSWNWKEILGTSGR